MPVRQRADVAELIGALRARERRYSGQAESRSDLVAGVDETGRQAALFGTGAAQHEAQPETTAKLRWLLSKSVAMFGDQRFSQLDSGQIAAWRIALQAPPRTRRRVAAA